MINKTLAQMNAERAAGPARHNLKLKRKNKKNKVTSSRVGPPNKVKGFKLEDLGTGPEFNEDKIL